MSIGVVIPVGPGRQENLAVVLRCLDAQTATPARVVVVYDGVWPDGGLFDYVDKIFYSTDGPGPVEVVAHRHQPGMEQPRNIGVHILRDVEPDTTHVWFLDSDIHVGPRCLEELELALAAGESDRIVVGPYDWLGRGERPTPGYEYIGARNDPRWPHFERYGPGVALTNDLSAGLACFSGNLLWPIDEFIRVGGFWSEIHHGRCEDGELGLRAVAMGVPISFASRARGAHLWHPVNTALALERNARDVPMLNARHPWLQGADVFMVDRDGKAFDVRCAKCQQQIPTVGWWAHAQACAVSPALPVDVVWKG